MSTITARRIVERVRGIINRIPVSAFPTSVLVDEAPWTNENVSVTASGTVSDVILLHHINHVQRFIVGACKVFHVPTNDEWADVTTGPTLSGDQILLRLVHGTVKRINSGAEVRARFRELSEHYDAEDSGRSATNDFPVYMYLDHETIVVPTPTEGTLGLHVFSPSTISTNNMVNLSDVLDIDTRFEPAIVAYVAAKAFRHLEEPGLHDVWIGLFKRKLEPFLLGTRIGEIRTHIISAAAYERENEVE